MTEGRRRGRHIASATYVEAVPKGYTEEDLRLGRRVIRYTNVLGLISGGIVIAISTVLFVTVGPTALHPSPATRGGYYPAWFLMLASLIMIYIMCGPRRSRTAYRMKQRSRRFMYIFASAVVLWVVFMTFVLAGEILAAEGFKFG